MTPQGGGSAQTFDSNLTTSSGHCTSSISTTSCSIAVSLADGSYTATFATYDGALDGNNKPTGHVLSQNQSVSFSIAANTSNTIDLSLYGVPASVELDPVSTETNVIGDRARGYALLGSGDVTFDIVAKDADGDFLIGPGMPVWSVTSDGSQIVVDRQPSSTTPTRVQLKAPAFSIVRANVTVAASAASAYATCVCSEVEHVSARALVESNDDVIVAHGGVLADPVAGFQPRGDVYYAPLYLNTIGSTNYADYTSAIYSADPPYTPGMGSTLALPASHVMGMDSVGTVYSYLSQNNGSTTNLMIYTSPVSNPANATLLTTIVEQSGDPNEPIRFIHGPNGTIAYAYLTGGTYKIDFRSSATATLRTIQPAAAVQGYLAIGLDSTLIYSDKNNNAPVVVLLSPPYTSLVRYALSGTVFPQGNLAAMDASGTLYFYVTGVGPTIGTYIVPKPYTAASATIYTSVTPTSISPLPSGVVLTTQADTTFSNVQMMSPSGAVTQYATIPSAIDGATLFDVL